ncbi:origin recognition complex subunit 3-like isoform X2 [Varroa jacobsoni]|uniref:origin recognition complex subunit 3-like isoform X2 n=1 Tax=Varroa jacobsoni TaxID=62625 RepID=UPI000BF809D0|nr:origin recognition complex subunit 3-like isoform X2 [Varroa jacobsoni]
MDTPLISQSCHVRKPSRPKKGPISKYSQIWQNLEQKLTAYHVEKHEQLIRSVLQFFSSGCDQKQENIPTAMIRLGSSVSDHSGVFGELSNQLHKVTPLICRLSPVDCTSLSGILQKMFNEFIAVLNLDDEPKIKRALISFENLVQIYKLVACEQPGMTCGSPRKRKTSKFRLGAKKFIIIIEDVTSVKTTILEDLSQILKTHLEEMDTCLVFGISSTAQHIHKILSLRCASNLFIRSFSSPPVEETLNGIFDLLVLNRDFPFKLEPELFNWMTDFVLYHDFSLKTMLHILRVALTIHLEKVDPKTIYSMCNPGTDHEIDKAMLLNSDNDSLRENLANVLVSLAGLRPGIFKNCFLSLQKKFFVDSAIFRKTEQVIRLLSANELRQRLQEHVAPRKSGEIADKLRGFCDCLGQDGLDENLSEAAENDSKQFTSRSEWKQAMLESARKKRTTKLDLIREDIISFLKDQAKNVLTLADLPHAEHIYIELRAMFAPTLRTTLNRALATPSSVLSCHCCRVKSAEASACLPPISIVYKLHLECGKMINVYDMLLSYQSVREDDSEVSIAEFLRALRELQVLGYVKPTTRKMDHLQRLTWGSC